MILYSYIIHVVRLKVCTAYLMRLYFRVFTKVVYAFFLRFKILLNLSYTHILHLYILISLSSIDIGFNKLVLYYCNFVQLSVSFNLGQH